MSLLQALLPNGLLAIFLALYVLFCRRFSGAPVTAALVGVLIYGTLHFSLGAWVLFTDPEPRQALNLMQREPVAAVRAWGAAFVLFILVFLAFSYRSEIKPWLWSRDRRNNLLLPVAGCAAALLAGLGLTAGLSGGPTGLAVKDVASMLVMLGLAVLLAAAWTAEGTGVREEALRRLLRVVAVLAALVVLVAVFELDTGQTRAYTVLSDGTSVERASSLLFDPNLLGMWCAAAAMFAGRFLLRPPDGRWAAGALILAGAGLLFSGSRTALLLYLGMAAVLLAHGVWHGGLRRLSGTALPAALAMGSLALTGLMAFLFDKLLSSPPHFVSAISLLAGRMLRLPLDLAGYVFASPAPQPSVAPQPGAAAPQTGGNYDPTAMSIEGRFGGSVPDNGYLATLDAAGPLGLAALAALILWLAFLVYRRVWPRPDADGGYAVAAGFGCALSAMFLRTFTVFPIWVFVACGLAVVLSAVLLSPKRLPETQDIEASPAKSANPTLKTRRARGRTS